MDWLDSGEDNGRRVPSVRVVAALAVALAVVGAASAVALVKHAEPGASRVRVASAPLDPTITTTSVEVPTTVTVPVTVPPVTVPPVTVPKLLPATPKTTVATTPRPTTTAAAKPARHNDRPPCPGQPTGYNGYGCEATATSGGVTVVFGLYGQVLQAGRDHLQQWVNVTDSRDGWVQTVKIDHGDGNVYERTLNTACQGQRRTYEGNNYIYPSSGSFDVTATVTSATCTSEGQWADVQTVKVTIPVRVCPRIEAGATEVWCV